MKAKYSCSPKHLYKAQLKKVTISLSPRSDYQRRMNQLPKISHQKESKTPNKSFKGSMASNDSYCITYIGDSSGFLSISSRKLKIPRYSHNEISKESRLKRPSPIFQNTNQHTISHYFRPKPLTPSSMKLHEFSQQIGRETATPQLVKNRNKHYEIRSFL